MLDKLKKVSLQDEQQNEWWILHKVETVPVLNTQEPDFVKSEVFSKSYNRQSIYKTPNSEVMDDFSLFRIGVETSFNKFGKRLSDISTFKTPNKRISIDIESKNDTKHRMDASKPNLGKLVYSLFRKKIQTIRSFKVKC